MAVTVPENILLSRLDHLANWVRANSLWPMPFATACCGIELMATGASKHDLARFGAEVMRFSPRQCDLMIVAGRVVMKMLPVLQRIWQQMPEPKWCISMGSVRFLGGCLRYLRGRAGDRPVFACRYVRSRMSAAAGATHPVDHRFAGKDQANRHHEWSGVSSARRVRRAHGPCEQSGRCHGGAGRLHEIATGESQLKRVQGAEEKAPCPLRAC